MNDNQLLIWLQENTKGKSIREIAKQLDVSAGYLNNVLKGTRNVTWNFAAAVALHMDLNYLEAFQMAGLIDKTIEEPDKK
jgi:transcriptional regulator with XRE-family HTH domain